MKQVCNGWRSDRIKYTESTTETIKCFLPELRNRFVKEYGSRIGRSGDLETKWRFNDDKNVICTLESAVLEEEFLKNPVDFIMDSLMNCADRDWYYMYEKQWD